VGEKRKILFGAPHLSSNLHNKDPRRGADRQGRGTGWEGKEVVEHFIPKSFVPEKAEKEIYRTRKESLKAEKTPP